MTGLQRLGLLLVFSTLIACGKKGPLYVPADKIPKPQIILVPASAAAPEQKKEAEDTGKDKSPSATSTSTSPATTTDPETP